MQADRHFCRSKNLDRVRKLHFLFVDVVSELLFCCLSDLFCRYASEYFSALADFDCYGNLFVLNLFRESLCLSELLCCHFVLVCFLEFQLIQVFCGCLDAEFFRQKHVSCISVTYVYSLSFFTKCFYVFQ